MDGLDKRANRPKARQSIAHIPSSSRSNSLDKQNATIDLSAGRKKFEIPGQQSKKRTRGKSLGPGGLEPLTETDGNATKAVVSIPPRSILKPTIPLTPPKSIPTFEELQQKSTTKKYSGRNSAEALLIDFSTPGPGRDTSVSEDSKPHNIPDPFSPVIVKKADVGDQTGDMQDTSKDDRERQERKKTILEQRAARRKSMANRRVSFAPEATLHTWSVMEMAEDSTTSSASNSTRRQSAMTTQQTPQRDVQTPKVDSDPVDPPSTPPKQNEEPVIKESPAHQRDLHQKKRRRRSSAISPDMDLSDDGVYSSSPSGDVMTESSPIRVEDSIASDSDTDGDTAMSMDEVTQNTVRSQDSGSSTHSSLEERLRQATSQAGIRDVSYDENEDDLSMELANDTVTRAFQPWAQSQRHQQDPMQDQENIDAFSPSKRAGEARAVIENENEDDTSGMTMEMTKAVGGILASNVSPSRSRRRSTLSRRRSSIGRRRSMAADSSYGDESMDFTTMAGGILSAGGDAKEIEDDSSEEMTMEITTAVGGVQHINERRTSIQSAASDENETMDMTAAVGGILAPIEEHTEPQTDAEDDGTLAMDMTRAVGQIMSNQLSQANVSSRNESDGTKITTDEFLNRGSPIQKGSHNQRTPKQRTSVASETPSPGAALKLRSAGRLKQSTTPKSPATATPVKSSSTKKQETPTKQLTPVPTRAQTPERTPVAKNISHRGASPKKLFEEELQAKISPTLPKEVDIRKQRDLLFAQDELTGRQTPRVVLHAPKPHQHMRRRSSGVGIDREGFGSPSVTQLLARRSSIGDAAPEFQLNNATAKRIQFEDPKQLEQQVDAERAEEERRESGRFIMAQEANGLNEENTTLQLKEMIESMSPKKSNGSRKSKGRKSLAVGSARGLLGKRPAELDDEDNDSESTPKRLKAISKDSSPVKKIHLPKPPSKEETTGRLTRFEQKALELAASRDHTPVLPEPSIDTRAVESPQQTNRYRDASGDGGAQRLQSFEDKLDNVVGAVDMSIEHPQTNNVVAEEDKVSLQQFLNMTNIHFIELNATKRRHTMAQSLATGISGTEHQSSSTLKSRFVAAATTMPLLELYQHATRELKSYISTGRKIIRSIEAETLVEQPPLFREYIEARPDIKLIMDNQFRNGKTNARLQSKEGWYTWRSQLVDGLRGGLESIQHDMKADLAIVQEQADGVTKVVPALEASRDSLADELSILKQKLIDVESVDHDMVKARRQDLQSLDRGLVEKRELLTTLQSQMQEKLDILSQAAELRDEMQEQIAEASRVTEEHRGWASKDVLALKNKTSAISKLSGWSLLFAEEDANEPNDFGVALTMVYRGAFKLYFHPSAFQPSSDGNRRRSGRNSTSITGPIAPISLTFMPKQEDNTFRPPLPTESRFFLQLIQGQLHAFSMMPQGSVDAPTLLSTVSSGCDLAYKVSEEIRLLNLTGITRVSIQGDEQLAVRLMLMLKDNSRVDIEFHITTTVLKDGHISISTSVSASSIHGLVCRLMDATKTRKVQTALNKEIGNKTVGEGAWVRAVQAFEEWHRLQCLSKPQTATQPKKEEPAQIEPAPPTRSTTPTSPIPPASRTPAVKRSPLAVKKPSALQKKTIPVATSRQDKLRTSQREQQPPSNSVAEKTPMHTITAQELVNGKENLDPFVTYSAPAMPPEIQEVMMQRTPIKRIGALRRSPI